MWTVSREIDLVISDIGGVLIDTFDAIVTVIDRVAKEKKCRGGEAENIYEVLGTSIEKYIRAYLPKKYKYKTKICYEAFKKEFPISVLHMLKPFYGVDQTLEFLHSEGIVIAVVSCLSENAIDMCLSRLRFKEIRDKVSYKRTKQDSKPINDLMKKYGVPKKRTVYIGDTVADIRMAKRAGVVSVAVKSGILGKKDPQKLEDASPDYLLMDFHSLPGVVLQREVSQEGRIRSKK